MFLDASLVSRIERLLFNSPPIVRNSDNGLPAIAWIAAVRLLRVRQIELDLRAASPLQQLFLKSVESLARLVHHQNCWIIQI